MKSSVLILLSFGIGIGAGILKWIPASFQHVDLVLYALYGLLFLVGIDIGSNPKAWFALKEINLKIVWVPLSIIVGTLLGASLFSLLLSSISISDALAVGAGFGYYSLSSVIISQIRGDALGVVALLANLSREIITIILSPLLVKYFGKLASIATGGATTMDTTLPTVAKFSGKDYVIIGLFSGAVLTFLVPILVPLILNFKQ